jgi:hypothetical protein
MSRKALSNHTHRDPARTAPDPNPIIIVPKQNADTIAERVRIREELHDERAITIKGRRRL